MTSRRQSAHHGYLVVDKPAGMTSHDVVSRVRRVVGERRVGHAGTLDPAATGVLPVAVGLATRTIEFLAEADKAYRATIRLGVSTDSHDRDGRLTGNVDDTSFDRDEILQALAQFEGEIEQTPPMHSAIKIDGQPLYRSARAGKVVDRVPRRVMISSIDIVEMVGSTIVVDVVCSKGTYVRSIARDLGTALGCGAYLAALVRTRSGPFELSAAIPLESLPDAIEERGWSAVAFHPEWGAIDAPAIVLDHAEIADWNQGRSIPGCHRVGGVHRVYGIDGAWLGVGRVVVDGACLVPVKVFPAGSARVDA